MEFLSCAIVMSLAGKEPCLKVNADSYVNKISLHTLNGFLQLLTIAFCCVYLENQLNVEFILKIKALKVRVHDG